MIAVWIVLGVLGGFLLVMVADLVGTGLANACEAAERRKRYRQMQAAADERATRDS